jgi:fibronectin type 3 domain-containing protein
MHIRKRVLASLGLFLPLAAVLLVAAAPAFAALPDLIVKSAIVKTISAVPGGGITVVSTVKNIGTASAGKSTVRFYLSKDTKKSAGDVRLAGSRAVGILGRGKSSTGTTKAKVPLACAPGLYYVIAVADDLKRVRESHETNNTLKAGTKFVVMAAPFVSASADAFGTSRIDLNWSTHGLTPAICNIYRSPTSGPLGSLLTSTTGSATSYSDGGLTPGAVFYYTIESVSSGAVSVKSPQITATTHAVPTFPAPLSGLTATRSGTIVTLSWDDYAGATQYELYRSYIPEILVGSGASQTAHNGAFVTSVDDVIAGNGHYSYLVGVYNADASLSAWARVELDVPAGALPGVESPILDFWAANTDVTVAHVYWWAAPGATAHHVYAAPDPGGGVVPPITPKQGASTAPLAFPIYQVRPGYFGMDVPLSSLPAGYTYVAVEAVKGAYAADSSWVTILKHAPAPVGVTGVRTNVRNPTKLIVSWDAAAGAGSYNVYQLTGPSDAIGPSKKIGATTGTSLTVSSGLSPSTTYYYRVTAIAGGAGGGAESGPSNYAAAKTFSDTAPLTVAGTPFVMTQALLTWIGHNDGTTFKIYGGASINPLDIDPNHLVAQTTLDPLTGKSPWTQVVGAPAGAYAIFVASMGLTIVWGYYEVTEVYPDGSESAHSVFLPFAFM